MGVVFVVGFSSFPGKEIYLDEIYTDLGKSKKAICNHIDNKPVKWELVTGENKCQVWRGEYVRNGTKLYIWIKPVALNTPDFQQRFELEKQKWNNPKLFK